MPDVPRTLRMPAGFTLDTLLSSYPPTDDERGLPNLAGFDRLAAQAEAEQVRRLNAWIEPQATCDYVIRHHGHAGLVRVLKGIAEASAKLRVPMGVRVRAVAGFYGLAEV